MITRCDILASIGQNHTLSVDWQNSKGVTTTYRVTLITPNRNDLLSMAYDRIREERKNFHEVEATQDSINSQLPYRRD